ncbi:ImmA/IrrE family metallo-endopeptidase [Spirosoma sp. BT702]|uniref:ImmA/IrrE family metallo-endopeptidase n=1 Tax=Spirosoma profusum TaxID=2771354 RepID=A0A926Y3H8_9BACT|nr:ImmA/IrrE family metallo-endopeptidase [Spirosoma profusum]MBD2703413.1 ImmA/IrrE family metallo-endopeptidase [Spirosoma profusum]
MKSKNNLLPRGFTTKAEKIAEAFRIDLKIHPCGHLCAFKLASHLGVSVCEATDYGIDTRLVERLIGWSGLYLVNDFGEKIVIHNTSHPLGRQHSTIMHELAHLVCEHPLPTEVILPELPFLRRYDPQHEQEAEYLGSTLQMTRKGLVWAMRRKMSITQIADYYKASEDMVDYRLHISGVSKQFSRK